MKKITEVPLPFDGINPLMVHVLEDNKDLKRFDFQANLVDGVDFSGALDINNLVMAVNGSDDAQKEVAISLLENTVTIAGKAIQSSGVFSDIADKIGITDDVEAVVMMILKGIVDVCFEVAKIWVEKKLVES